MDPDAFMGLDLIYGTQDDEERFELTMKEFEEVFGPVYPGLSLDL